MELLEERKEREWKSRGMDGHEAFAARKYRNKDTESNRMS